MRNLIKEWGLWSRHNGYEKHDTPLLAFMRANGAVVLAATTSRILAMMKHWQWIRQCVSLDESFWCCITSCSCTTFGGGLIGKYQGGI
ncbi:hypothetical protein [Moraxella bovis]|uniref:hypothetical protein n=1 Tax=Moraxella bovis TaxID=476 RepID=UPI002225D6CE|nr:hypothetical protein [Moraxella bovis]UYZ79850.1 hypothetical protein LP113_07200 [Moraxella bovis]